MNGVGLPQNVNIGLPLDVELAAPPIIPDEEEFFAEEFQTVGNLLKEGASIAINDEEVGLKKSVHDRIDKFVEENTPKLLNPVKECNKQISPMTAPCTNKSLDVSVAPTIKKVMKYSAGKSFDNSLQSCVNPGIDKSVKVVQKSTQKSVEGTKSVINRSTTGFWSLFS